MVNWKNSLFVLLTPDALVRHLARPILERFHANGFVPQKYQLVYVTSEDLDALYQINIEHVWDTYRYRLVDQLFNFGPCLVVLLTHNHLNGEDSHQRMKQMKGNSHPYKALSGTIRHDFYGLNSILGLMHSSDTPEESERESRIFFRSGRKFLQTSKMETDSTIWDLLESFEMSYPKEMRDYDAVLAGLRAKIVVALWSELTPTGREMVRSLQKQGIEAWVAPGTGKRLAEELLYGLKHPLAGILECEFLPDAPRLDMVSVETMLRGYGIEMDRWELLVLNTSMYFQPTRRRERHEILRELF
ncbi:nucleoside-diphosphate kinase [Thermoflavimicrobium daqui]|nr:nucleoside-diphosphate kinase [Thermoflavimicrobium daqui]